MTLASIACGCTQSVATDPCSGVTCSGHGGCAIVAGSARCACDRGFHEQGLACVADTCSATNPCVDDGDRCTNDACTVGVCLYERIAGCCARDLDCDDANRCTIDACDRAANTCLAPLTLPDGTPCDSGGAACLAGVCPSEMIVNGDFAAALDGWTGTDVSVTDAPTCWTATGTWGLNAGGLELHGNSALSEAHVEQSFVPVRPSRVRISYDLAVGNCSGLDVALIGGGVEVLHFFRGSGWFPPYGDAYGVEQVNGSSAAFAPAPGTCVTTDATRFYDLYCANNTGWTDPCFAGRYCQPRAGLLEMTFDWAALRVTVTVDAATAGTYQILDPTLRVDTIRLGASHGCCDGRNDVYAYFDDVSLHGVP